MRGLRAHVTLTLIAAAIAAAGGSASAGAQTVTSPYMDTNPNVTVDLSVLDGLGSSSGYGAPMQSPGAYPPPNVSRGASNDVPAFLVRPDAPRYAAPPPEVQALIQGGSGHMSPPSAPRALAPSGPAPTLRAPEPRPTPRATSAQTARPAPVRQPAPTPTAVPAEPKVVAPKPSAPEPRQSASVAPTPPPPPPAPSTMAKTTSAPAAPPPPALPKPAQTASAAPPPPPPPEPKKDEVKRTSTAPAAPTSAPAPKPSVQTGDTTRIAFPAGQSQLPGDAAGKLDPLIAKLKQDSGLRVQLMAYADGDQEGANKARRLSLSRALAVRAYLIDNDIASTRMDVRALGNRADDGPGDRVDLLVINR